MGSAKDNFDAIIIGAGQAGVPLAHDLAEAGWKVALIERRFVGGTCINDGCTPTKTLLASARIAHLARRGPEYGVQVEAVEIDFSQIIKRKNEVVQSFRQSNRQRLVEHPSIELIMGEASFLSPHQIQVQLGSAQAERQLEADIVIINSGGRPRWPDIVGLDSVQPLTSTSIMELEKLPEHLIVLGGGYVGLEFGQMFRRFGSKVTILQHGQQLLSREDADIATEVTDILRDEGIDVVLNAETTSIERTTKGMVKLNYKAPEGAAAVTGSHLLLAVGRVPNTEALNLEAAGVAQDKRGNIKVDDKLATNVAGIYAMGDVKGGPAFTHISYDDYRVLSANLLHNSNRTIEGRMVPYNVFIDPQLGRVGMTEGQAQKAGLDYQVASMPMAHVARAIEVGETRGMLKAIVQPDSKQILGVAFLGIEAGELMGAAQLAMKGNLPYTQLRDGIFAHPTLTEAFNNLFASLD